MALLNSEMIRIKYELGFSTLAIAAEPYIGIVAVFDQVVQVYAGSGAVTTSTTAVTAASSLTPVTLTLDASTGFDRFAQVVVDVDDRQEIATLQSVSGSDVTVMLEKAHSGTYPVTVEGAESLIRGILRKLVSLDGPEGLIAKAASAGGIKRAEEVEFFPSSSGTSKSKLDEALAYREYLRGELSRAIFGAGCGDRGSSRIAVY